MQQVHTNRFLAPTHIVMHPRRWAALVAASDTAGRPLVVPVASGRFNAMEVIDIPEHDWECVGGDDCDDEGCIRVECCIITGDYRILVMRAADSYLWEGTPRAEALPQTYGDKLNVLVRFYNYAAFTGERYNTAVSVIGGSGLVTPVFG